MPRYQQLKGNMNPFNNNKPILSASERLKNKRDKTIYQSQKMNYKSSKTCGNTNVKYYDNGTVRSTNSFKMNMKLSRGAALCNDCDNNGTFCTPLLQGKKFTKITMGNNKLAQLKLGTGIIDNGGMTGIPQQSSIIIVSDVSGVWGGSLTDISKSIIGPSADYPFGCGSGTFPPCRSLAYGYTANTLNIPRNLNGSGVVIDPYNLLFRQDENCNTRTSKLLKPKFLESASLETTIIYEGFLGAGSSGPFFISSVSDTATVASGVNQYKKYIGSFCTFRFNDFVPPPVLETGISAAIITKICPTGKKELIYSNFPVPGAVSFEVDIFKIFFDIISIRNTDLWQGTIIPNPNGDTSREQFIPNTITEFAIRGFDKLTSGPGFFAFWINSQNCRNPGGVNGGAGAKMKIIIDQNDTKNCSNPQIRGNTTKQNYLSCVEDKTKNIKFAKNFL